MTINAVVDQEYCIAAGSYTGCDAMHVQELRAQQQCCQANGFSAKLCG